MIDKVKIYHKKELDASKFSFKLKHTFKEVSAKIDSETGEIITDGYTINKYIYSHNGLEISYSPISHKLIIEGRLVNILNNRNLVCNITDYSLDKLTNQLVPITNLVAFSNKEYSYLDTSSLIISKVNDKLYELTGVKLDISNFKTYLVETSFNIFNTEHPNLYIRLFNEIFNSKKQKRHTSHVKEYNLSDDTSFYIKPKSTYEKNKKTSYAINFYDKYNQLNNYKNKPDNKIVIHNYDLQFAKNILRLEVQAYNLELSKHGKTFKTYLNINNCLNIVINKYRSFICLNEDADFYSYRAAKNVIELSEVLSSKEKGKLLEYIKDKYKSNKKFSDTKERTYRNLLLKLNIHPYFIPTKWGIDYLESPIKILRKQYNLNL